MGTDEGAGATGHRKVLVRIGTTEAARGELSALQLDRQAVENLRAGVVDQRDGPGAGLPADGSIPVVGQDVAEDRVVPCPVVAVVSLERWYIDDVLRAELHAEPQHTGMVPGGTWPRAAPVAWWSRGWFDSTPTIGRKPSRAGAARCRGRSSADDMHPGYPPKTLGGPMPPLPPVARKIAPCATRGTAYGDIGRPSPMRRRSFVIAGRGSAGTGANTGPTVARGAAAGSAYGHSGGRLSVACGAPS